MRCDHPLVHRRRAYRSAVVLVAVLATLPAAFAQSTSAGVGGQVFSSADQPLAGASVSIIHVESGTVSRVLSDANGRYAARGLRVGGPYTITISKPGEGTGREEHLYLNLNQVSTVNMRLPGDLTTTLETVSALTGHLGVDIFSANKMGTGSNVTRESIQALPSVTGNMQDFIRLDPRIVQTSKADGAISAGGQNSRYNAIRIDGIGAGDPFGVGANNFPTERQPVSMDAIEEINIDLANYDTTIFGGTGAVINAVTRSGTNEQRGTLYYSMRDKDWVRTRLQGEEFNGFDKEETYGFTFGGPLIKDRLFFFGNYERYVRSAAGASLTGTPYGRGDITDADVAALRAAAQTLGFDPGGLSPPGRDKTEIEEYALKLDWNISEQHRAAIRYNKIEQNVLRFPGIGPREVSFSGYWHAQPKTYKTFMGELFSTWGENLSTELKVSWKDYAEIAIPNSRMPQVQVLGFGASNATVNMGTWVITHAYEVASRELNLFAAANLYLGEHTLKFGFDHQDNDLISHLGRNINGAYAFNSLTDFQAGMASVYSVRTPRPEGSYADIPAAFTLKNTGIFLQDTWVASYHLNIMFGVRVDVPDYSKQRLYNPLIEDVYGYDNTRVPDSTLVQPRLGFNYTFDHSRPMQLRGGVGLFAGAAPNVWLSSAYQNTGLNYLDYICVGADVPEFSANPAPNLPANCSASNARVNVDVIAPDFKLPSVWKTNLAFDHELPWHGIVASLEGLWTRVKHGIYVQRLDLFDGHGNGPSAFAQDGRPLFWNAAGLDPGNRGDFGIDPGINGAQTKVNRPDGIGDVMLLNNTNKGSSRQLTLGLEKPLQIHWGWSLFYTRTHATEVSPMTNSQLTSTWGNFIVGTANEDTAYDSRYAIRDRVTAQLHWKKALFSDYNTRMSVFYEGRSGRPFSYIFANDANGDGDPARPNAVGYFNDLFYVPNGPGDVLWTGGAVMEQKFFDWLAQHPDLARYQGRIAPANAFRSGWTNSVDVRISQELPGLHKRHSSEIALDIMNLGNLINKNWGLIEDYGFESRSEVAHYAGIDPVSGQYVYHFTGGTDAPGIQENNSDKGNTAVSRWSLMLSIKYKF